MQKNTCRYVQDTYTYTYRILTCKYMILTCQYQILTRQYHIRTVHIGPYLHVFARNFLNASLLLPPASICFRLLPIITGTSGASLRVRIFIPINRPQAQQQAVNHPIGPERGPGRGPGRPERRRRPDHRPYSSRLTRPQHQPPVQQVQQAPVQRAQTPWRHPRRSLH